MKFFFIFILIVFWKSAFALSSKDVDLYKSIFNDYRNGNFKDADRNVEKLDDLILMGHVEALKLLHPTKHRSSFSELRIWLSKYNDQYESKRIYKLAIKRMPSGSQKPEKNKYPIIDEIFLEKQSKEKVISPLRKIFTSKNFSKKVSIYNTVRSRVGRGWPTGALEYLEHHKKNFNDKELSFLLSKIFSFYFSF